MFAIFKIFNYYATEETFLYIFVKLCFYRILCVTIKNNINILLKQ